MLIVQFGLYHFGRKRIGYRNDYCLKCNAERISEQYWMFDVGHVYWIPLIPLGVRRRWYCAACGKDPHKRLRTSRWVKIVGAIWSGIVTVAIWMTPIPPDEAGETWAARMVITFIFVALIIATVRDKGDRARSLKEKLASLTPLTGETCLYCKGPLLPELVPRSRGTNPHQQTRNCRACGVRRY